VCVCGGGGSCGLAVNAVMWMYSSLVYPGAILTYCNEKVFS
jgi:hypothetical protein